MLADPSTHAAIDDTGWVCEAVDPAPITAPGQVFRMGMYHEKHPDGSYEMANRVEVCDAPRAIAWRPGQYDSDTGELGFGGWTWRYDLAAAGDGATEVTLTYDWSNATAAARSFIAFPPFGPAYLEDSLRHLAELAR